MKNTKVTIKDIRESFYDANLDTEYREALVHAMLGLEYINDSPLNLYFGTEKQKKEIERVDTKQLNYNEISEIIHLMMYEMRDDFQYGSFKPVVDYYINISKGMQKEEVAADKCNNKPICKVKTTAVMYELICSASKTLKQNNMYDESRKMIEKATKSYSYDESLKAVTEYVEIIKKRELQKENEEEFE